MATISTLGSHIFSQSPQEAVVSVEPSVGSGSVVGGRHRMQILGVAHTGFGFEPQAIAAHAREVARQRAAVSDLQRAAVAQTPFASPLPALSHGSLHGRDRWAETPAQAVTAGIRGGSWSTSNGTTGSGEARRPARLQGLVPVGGGSLAPQALAGAPSPHRRAEMSRPILPGDDRLAVTEGAHPGLAALRVRGEEMVGTKPSVWLVLLATMVDASLSFAVLAACHLAVGMGDLSSTITKGLDAWAQRGGGGLPSWWPERARMLMEYGDASASMALAQPYVHGALVVIMWMSTLFMVQIFCVSAFGATLGRLLAGMRVNPVVSRSRGILSLPMAEILTLGGLLALPFVLVKTDRAALAPGVRFKS